MRLGYKRLIGEKDIWQLDNWDKTEILYSNFQQYWDEEQMRPNPWLLHALNRSLVGVLGFGLVDFSRSVMMPLNLLVPFS